MDSRYFLYDVHTSLTFLRAPTLAARLYLVLLQLLTRQYASAFQLLDACHVDTAFTAAEKWIFAQFDRANDDKHPDAHAVRLRAALAIAHSDNTLPYELHTEYDEYLSKLPMVSAACRLDVDDEIALLVCYSFVFIFFKKFLNSF